MSRTLVWVVLIVRPVTSAAFIQGRISIWKMLYHWTFCFFGNLAGALFVMAIIFGCKSRSSPLHLAFSTDLRRRRRLRRRPVPGKRHRLCDGDTNQAAVASDLPARHRVQLARVPSAVLRGASQGPCLKGHWHVVSHLLFCDSGTGSRCRQHVFHSAGYLSAHAGAGCRVVYLEG
jgi:hypothetical protein